MAKVYVFRFTDGTAVNEATIYGQKSKEDALEAFRKEHPTETIKHVEEKETRNVYDIITDKIVAEMQNGIIPWQRPWTGVRNGAISFVTRKPYSMLNQMILGRPGEWLTWKQIQERKGRIKKGAKAGMVTFWKVYLKGKDGEEIEDDGSNKDNVDKRYVLRYYNVYHIDDVEGIESKIVLTPHNPDVKPVEDADKVASSYVERNSPLEMVVTESNRAYYSPSADKVVIPKLEQFHTTEQFYGTMFHELTHSTGHKSRLDRASAMEANFGSEEYSKEELVAEIGSAMLVNHLGLDSEKAFRNTVAYLQNWLQALKNDTKMIVYAASKAEKAVKYILNIKDEQEATLAE